MLDIKLIRENPGFVHNALLITSAKKARKTEQVVIK